MGSHRFLFRWLGLKLLDGDNVGLAVKIQIFSDFLEAQLLWSIILDGGSFNVGTDRKILSFFWYPQWQIDADSSEVGTIR